MSVQKDIRFRVYIAFSCIVIFAMLVIGKVIHIQQAEGKELRAKAEHTHTRTVTLHPNRGNIYTEDGTLLSATIPHFDLYIDFKVIDKDTFWHYVDEIAQQLAEICKDASASTYKNRLETAFKRGERYWSLKKRTPYFQYQQIRELSVFNKGKNRGGLISEQKTRRENPYGILAYRTIGLWRENSPLIGLEEKYDSVLTGYIGNKVEIKSTGNVWMPIQELQIDPINGMDIVTTIDIDIQDVTEHALLEAVEKYHCQYGTAIVMEVATGKIKAIANLGRQEDGTYWEDFNYAMIPTEPGSTFKLASMFALVEDGYLTINDQVDIGNGMIQFGRQRVRDDYGKKGKITLKQAFVQSSNVAFAKSINDYYGKQPMKYIKHLQKFRLHEPTGVEISGERLPTIKTTKHPGWNKTTSLPWIAYGYESAITPLHICMMYNAIANDGQLMKPYLVSAIRSYDKTISSFQPTVLEKRIGKKTTIKQLQEAMREVVESGTAKGIKSPYYHAAGKTGTAQVVDKGISYKSGVRQGSFVGYFPFDKPKYTIAVVVRSTPKGAYYGAVVAAPVFKKIADKLYASEIGGWDIDKADNLKKTNIIAKKAIAQKLTSVFRILNIPYDSQQSKEQTIAFVQTIKNGTIKLQSTELPKEEIIPDLNGMGLRDALFILESAGLQVQIKGKGEVVQQSIPPGARISKGQKIELYLSENNNPVITRNI